MDIEKLKEQFGPLFMVTIGGTDFVFKQLSLAEFSEIGDQDLTADVADVIIEKGVVSPKGKELLLGELLALADSIIKASGWGDPEVMLRVLDEKRKTAQLMFPQAKSALCTVFNMKPDEVGALQIEEFSDLVSQAEIVTGQRLFKTRAHRGIPSIPPPQGYATPGGKWGASGVNLQTAGIEPSFDSLSNRIENETGNVPLTYEEAKDRKKRPEENLPKKGLEKAVSWVHDLRQFQNPDAWPDR